MRVSFSLSPFPNTHTHALTHAYLLTSFGVPQPWAGVGGMDLSSKDWGRVVERIHQKMLLSPLPSFIAPHAPPREPSALCSGPNLTFEVHSLGCNTEVHTSNHQCETNWWELGELGALRPTYPGNGMGQTVRPGLPSCLLTLYVCLREVTLHLSVKPGGREEGAGYSPPTLHFPKSCFSLLLS